MVRLAWASRTMKRSPGAAHSASSTTSCTRPRAPGAMPSSDRSTACARRRAVPRCRCSGAQLPSVSAASGSSSRSTSRLRVGRKARASAIQSPRAIASRPVPARLSAQRCPARASSLGRFWAWMERTRTGVPAGASTRWARSSPASVRPANTVPVTIVPWPGRVKTRSTARRNRPSALRAAAACARSSRCRRRASTPGSPSRVVSVANIGAPASGPPCSSVVTSARTASSRAASTRSALVMATAPWSTPSRPRIARCSRVCGITPSSAATTSRPKSMPQAPAAMVCTSFSCPGTST